MNRFVLLAAWLMLAGELSAAQPADGCLKPVFQDYCLGGSLRSQLEKSPAGMQPQINGERRGVIYTQDAEKVYVMAYRDTIYNKKGLIICCHRCSAPDNHTNCRTRAAGRINGNARYFS